MRVGLSMAHAESRCPLWRGTCRPRHVGRRGGELLYRSPGGVPHPQAPRTKRVSPGPVPTSAVSLTDADGPGPGRASGPSSVLKRRILTLLPASGRRWENQVQIQAHLESALPNPSALTERVGLPLL